MPEMAQPQAVPADPPGGGRTPRERQVCQQNQSFQCVCPEGDPKECPREIQGGGPGNAPPLFPGSGGAYQESGKSRIAVQSIARGPGGTGFSWRGPLARALALGLASSVLPLPTHLPPTVQPAMGPPADSGTTSGWLTEKEKWQGCCLAAVCIASSSNVLSNIYHLLITR